MSCKETKENLPVVSVGINVDYASYVENLASIMGLSHIEDVTSVLSIIFSKLGFGANDSIIISRTVDSAWDMVRLEFEINDEKVYKCNFSRRQKLFNFNLSVTDDKNNSYNYDCKTPLCAIDKTQLNNFDISMLLKDYNIEDSNNSIICRRGFDEVRYCFSSPVSVSGNMEQQVLLKVKCPPELVELNKEKDEYYTPRNERALMAYLSKQPYPVKIDKVFQDVITFSFNNEVKAYPLFDLHVSTIRHSKQGQYRVVSDIVRFKDGELDSFGMMHTGSTSGCAVKNNGAIVELIGDGYMNYHTLVPRKGFLSFRGVSIDAKAPEIDQGVVSETKEKLIKMFPEEAERFLGSEYASSACTVNEDSQMTMFTGESKQKQLKKLSETK